MKRKKFQQPSAKRSRRVCLSARRTLAKHSFCIVSFGKKTVTRQDPVFPGEKRRAEIKNTETKKNNIMAIQNNSTPSEVTNYVENRKKTYTKSLLRYQQYCVNSFWQELV